jgi:UDP-N-acetylmuramoyl-tripeptide--D-alanyl-D-alanine ligase
LKGEYFIALSGKNFDGHDYIKQAIEKKAGGIIVSSKILNLDNSIPAFPTFPSIVRVNDTLQALGDIAGAYRRKWAVPLVAITGTNGKTTTKEMLSSILNNSGTAMCNKGNMNNQVGVPVTLLNLGSKYSFAVIELGTSWPGEIARLSQITAPDIGIITNIGLGHLENFKDLNGVFEEKITLINSLPSSGTAIINADDPYLEKLKPSVECLTFGFSEKADVRAANIRLWPDLPSFETDISGEHVHIRLPLYGKFNIYNALAACAAAVKLGIKAQDIVKGLETFSLPKWRMEKHQLLSGALVINDAYNANPSSMRESIESIVESFQDKEKVVVLGDMLELGENSSSEHKELGEFISAKPLSRVIFFGEQMKNAFAAVKDSGAEAKHFMKKDELVLEIRRHMNSDSVILFKASRGIGFEEVVGSIISREEDY